MCITYSLLLSHSLTLPCTHTFQSSLMFYSKFNANSIRNSMLKKKVSCIHCTHAQPFKLIAKRSKTTANNIDCEYFNVNNSLLNKYKNISSPTQTQISFAKVVNCIRIHKLNVRMLKFEKKNKNKIKMNTKLQTMKIF